MQTALLYHYDFLDHDTGPGHPETPKRLSHVIRHLENQPWFHKLVMHNESKNAEDLIELVHDSSYIKHARNACSEGLHVLDTEDVSISFDSFRVASLAVGSAVSLADKIARGEFKNGFALLRPPGHHAEVDRAMGFCLFNNAAIIAKYLKKEYGYDRILILDWDVHHGNGTQHIFEEDPDIFYMSLHQYPFYPGTGSRHETGIGKGKGRTLNCPMKSMARDAAYHEAFNDEIIPAIEAFKPQFVIISAGFDAHAQDPLGHILLSTDCFKWMTDKIKILSEQYAEGRLLSILEGGYHLQALSQCVSEHIKSLIEK